MADADGDGVCDDEDECVGMLDACGVCNGPGDIYECGCTELPVEDCDCDGNQLDALGVCGGDCMADAMAMAFAMTRMLVSVRLMPAAYAMAGRFMPVDARTSPRAIAIAMAMNSTP